MKTRLAVRTYVDGTLQSEDLLNATDAELETILPGLAAQHAEQQAKDPGMTEIEFLDEPDENSRYFRIGTDPKHMVQPTEFEVYGD